MCGGRRKPVPVYITMKTRKVTYCPNNCQRDQATPRKGAYVSNFARPSNPAEESDQQKKISSPAKNKAQVEKEAKKIVEAANQSKIEQITQIEIDEKKSSSIQCKRPSKGYQNDLLEDMEKFCLEDTHINVQK